MTVEESLADLPLQAAVAIRHFWQTRQSQGTAQKLAGVTDAGNRGAVTGGKQMDGFIGLANTLLTRVGVEEACVLCNTRLELPGFYRPTKKWDLLVVKDGKLLLVMEVKSQVGSFGNNFNNRTEEAMGSAL